MNLSELHDCKKSHGKMVMISHDLVGVTRCGYCNKVVDYTAWFKSELGDDYPYVFDKKKDGEGMKW